MTAVMGEEGEEGEVVKVAIEGRLYQEVGGLIKEV